MIVGGFKALYVFLGAAQLLGFCDILPHYNLDHIDFGFLLLSAVTLGAA